LELFLQNLSRERLGLGLQNPAFRRKEFLVISLSFPGFAISNFILARQVLSCVKRKVITEKNADGRFNVYELLLIIQVDMPDYNKDHLSC
jgi:hypothetical protein